MVQNERNKIAEFSTYNIFCKELNEGDVLYNVDSTNGWGDYLLVANIATVKLFDKKTYTVMLLGLTKNSDGFKSRNVRIKLTPDYSSNVPFLKCVGHCDFRIEPVIKNIRVNIGLATSYGTVGLKKFKDKLDLKKPKVRKYGKDGKLILQKAENKPSNNIKK